MPKTAPIFFALLFLLAGCSAIKQLGADTTSPEVRLTVLNGLGTPVFSTREGADRPPDACAYARSFPIRIAIAASDSGGIALVSARVFPASTIETSVATIPTAPDAKVFVEEEGHGDRITVQVKQPPGDVQFNALVTVDLGEDALTKIFVRAKDISGNASELYQIDIRPIRDPAACRDG
jgi:hypothetical protein